MNRNKQILFWLIPASIFIAGCDGNDVPSFGPEQNEVYSGQFLDSAVANLDYNSSTQSGTTDTAGRFHYQEGESVTFTVGKVTLGTASGQAVVTPVNLVSNSSSSTPEVQNIARFLLALDQDDDPRNGITISPTVKSAAESWSPVDFSADDFDSQISPIITEVGNMDGRTAVLPNVSETKQHLDKTIFCAYGGAYSGTYSTATGNNGTWIALVDSVEGGVTGFINDDSGSNFQMIGQLNANSTTSFSANIYPSGILSNWEGSLSSAGVLVANSGDITGIRYNIGLSENTKGDIYRGSLAKGNQTDVTNIYAIVFAVDGVNITGRAYSLARKTYVDIQPQLINENTIQFSLDGTELIGGGLNTSNYISIAGNGGQENIQGTACKIP